MTDRACAHTHPDGRTCEALPGANEFCYFHDPARAEERFAARSAGGISKSKADTIKRTMLDAIMAGEVHGVKLRDEADVLALCRASVNLLLKEALEPKIAQAIASMGGLALKALDQGKVDKKLDEFREQLRPLIGLTTQQLAEILRGAPEAPEH